VSSTKLTIVYSTNSNLIAFNGHRNDHSNGPLQSNISHKELGICTHECNDGLLRGLEYDPGGLVLNVKFKIYVECFIGNICKIKYSGNIFLFISFTFVWKYHNYMPR